MRRQLFAIYLFEIDDFILDLADLFEDLKDFGKYLEIFLNLEIFNLFSSEIADFQGFEIFEKINFGFFLCNFWILWWGIYNFYEDYK